MIGIYYRFSYDKEGYLCIEVWKKVLWWKWMVSK